MLLRLSVLLILMTVINTVAAKELAPEWELRNEAGETVKLSDFKGNPLILHFWATWCPYCKKLQPGLDKLYKKYKAQGLQMVAVSWWEDEGAKPQAMLDSRGHSFKTVINGDKVAREDYGVTGTPTTFFIDKNGVIISKSNQSDPDDPRLEAVIKHMLEIK